MKKSIVYELKRIILPLCIFTAIASAIFTLTALTTDFIGPTYYSHYESEVAKNSLVYIPAVILLILSYVVPVMQFSYRMKRRSTDLWYSLPIRRSELVLVRTIGGIALILVPYTVSYWLGFAVIACSENMFSLGWYVPLYFAAVPAALCLFGINSFCFTRANTMHDGIIFIIALNLALIMPYLFLINYYYRYVSGFVQYCLGLLPFIAPIHIFISFDILILNRAMSSANQLIISCVLCAIEGAAAYFGLFRTASKHKSENAGQISDSLFGYKTLIPWYVFFSCVTTVSTSGIFGMISIPLISLIMNFIYGLIAYFVYRRSFRIKKYDLLVLGITCIAAVAFTALQEYVLLV